MLMYVVVVVCVSQSVAKVWSVCVPFSFRFSLCCDVTLRLSEFTAFKCQITHTLCVTKYNALPGTVTPLCVLRTHNSSCSRFWFFELELELENLTVYLAAPIRPRVRSSVPKLVVEFFRVRSNTFVLSYRVCLHKFFVFFFVFVLSSEILVLLTGYSRISRILNSSFSSFLLQGILVLLVIQFLLFCR